MHKILLLCFLLFIINQDSYAQPSDANQLKHYRINDKQLGTINFQVSVRDINKCKPLLLYLDGSGDRPLYRYVIEAANHQSRMIYSTTLSNFDSLAAKYHIVFISKPGIPFADSFFVRSFDSSIEVPTPPEYTKKLSAEWRAKAASSVIDYLCLHLKVDAKKVVVVGYSEGALLPPRVAVANKKVTHVVCFSGNGINQLYDFIIQERLRATKGEISEIQAQANIDILMAVFKDIYAHPHATDKFWNGHTYQRWASFCTNDPLDYMLKLHIPIYIAHGTADDNTQILNADYVALEFLKRGKKNLIYKTYPDYDHLFQEVYKDKAPTQHINEVMNEMFAWLDKQ